MNETAELFLPLVDYAYYFLFDNKPPASKPSATPISRPTCTLLIRKPITSPIMITTPTATSLLPFDGWLIRWVFFYLTQSGSREACMHLAHLRAIPCKTPGRYTRNFLSR